MGDELMTGEAAAVIGVTRSQVQYLCRHGGLPCRKEGEGRHATYFIARADAEAYRDGARKAGWTKGKARKNAAPNE